MRLIIIIRGLFRTTHPQTVGEFKHSPKFDAYTYEGREFTPSEFNAFMKSKDWERILERHGQRIRVQVVNFNDMKAARKALKPADATV